MIVDIHSHTWQHLDHFTEDFRQQARTAKGGGDLDLTVTYEAYCAAAGACDRTVVFGGKARLSGLWVDDRYVAEFAHRTCQRPDTGVVDTVVVGHKNIHALKRSDSPRN